MSHRKPLHPPTKLLLRTQKLAPALVEALAAEAPSSTPALLSTIKAAMPSLSPRELGSVCMRVLPIAAWTTSKHVYEIDGEVAGSLSGQSLDGELPVELFERLPYPSLYVEDASSFRGFGTRGFLATVLGDNAGGESLWLCFFPSNETQPVQIVSLDVKRGNTIAKAVEALVETDTVFIGSNTFALSNANLRRELSRAVNLLLYVVSSEADAEVVYRPPGGRKEGRRSNPETVTLVGSRMGHAIGEARIRATASERDATGPARQESPLAALLGGKAKGPRRREVRRRARAEMGAAGVRQRPHGRPGRGDPPGQGGAARGRDGQQGRGQDRQPERHSGRRKARRASDRAGPAGGGRGETRPRLALPVRQGRF